MAISLFISGFSILLASLKATFFYNGKSGTINHFTMKRLLFFSVAVLFLFALNSCFHDWVTPSDTTAKGEWQWVFSVGGIGGDTIRPSEKAIITLTLHNDSTYVLYQGAGLRDSSRYSIHSTTNQSILKFPHALVGDKLYLQPEQLIVKKDSTALHLFDYNITDGYDHYFKKAN